MDLISTLTYFGITPTKYPYIVLGILIIVGFGYLRFSLGGSLKKIRENLLVVITHLASSARGKLDTNLIKQMSPYKIQAGGYDILRDSNFIQIFENNKNSFFTCVREQNPHTKLDVENHSILCYGILLDKEFMNPVKTYLYEHPDTRDTYPILAGVYIRDMYLKDHPEITQ